MIHYEFQNIKKLEANKAVRASEISTVSSLNEFLLNISSNQVEVPVNFNSQSWSENVSSRDTS